MEKYTDLEQAILDSSIVLITDDITTQKELNKAYIKYKVLSNKQKRFSNYYSYKFFGHSVTGMYVLVKDKMIDEGDIFEQWIKINEKYMLSEPDLYYNENSFNSGDTNVCFILGHSGSGKSSMARTLEGNDIEHIELDDLLLVKDHFTMDELKNYSDMFADFFEGEGAKYYIGDDERHSISKEEYEDQLFIDFIKFATTYSEQHREKKYIIEGIWLYLYFDDPSVFEDYAVFIKGTSFLKSKIRAMKREMQRDRETYTERKKMFSREARNYFLDENKIDIYRDFFGDKPETVFRTENNEDEKKHGEIVNELKNINKCFVDGDVDGIKQIMKKAEKNAELSVWNKMRIINECQAALIDFRL